MAESTRFPILILAAGLLAPLTSPFAQLPSGFTKTTVAPAGSVKNGTSLAHAPDGRIFAAEIGGTVKVIKGGAVRSIHTVSTNTEREQGLLKIEIHPRFAENGWLYLYYLTSTKHHHNIDRIALDKDSKVLESRTLVELVPLTNQGRHNGSGMAFGKDGFLYVGRGEDEQDFWASQWATARGKILRFTEDGKPAPGNPHAGQGTAEEQSIWSRGHRNPWALTMDPLSGRIFEGEVGASHEEINDITRPDAAKDYWYGWGGGGDGPNQGANTIKPFFSYSTGSLGCAITGVAAYNAAGSTWPEKWRNRIYFVDWCSSFIRGVDIANPGAGSEYFLTSGAPRAMGLTVGVDGGLYWLDHNGGSLNRISDKAIPSGIGADASRARSAVARMARVGGSLSLDLGSGGSGFSGKARLTLYDGHGKSLGTRSIAVMNSRAIVSQHETSAPGILNYRVEWREEGMQRASIGRILILP